MIKKTLIVLSVLLNIIVLAVIISYELDWLDGHHGKPPVESAKEVNHGK